jgi:hypothetical protein
MMCLIKKIQCKKNFSKSTFRFLIINYYENSDIEAIKLHQVCAHIKN